MALVAALSAWDEPSTSFDGAARYLQFANVSLGPQPQLTGDRPWRQSENMFILGMSTVPGPLASRVSPARSG